MYLTPTQIEESLKPLGDLHNFFGMSYLAFKRAGIPEGSTVTVNFSKIAGEILEDYYKPSTVYEGYYNPFKTSRKGQRWTAQRYPSTSLQRITKDTFSDVLLHPTKSDWGWRMGYVAKLKKHLVAGPIPAFHLAVWLFRREEWPDKVTPEEVRRRLFSEFKISEDEITKLFDVSDPPHVEHWASAKSPVTEAQLLRVMGKIMHQIKRGYDLHRNSFSYGLASLTRDELRNLFGVS